MKKKYWGLCKVTWLGAHPTMSNYWVAVKEGKLSYKIGETLLFSIYTNYGNLIQVP